MRTITLGFLAAMMMAIGAPSAQAFTDCHWVPHWCPPGDSDDGGHSVPEPGTIGLLALGAAASIGMLRRRSKDKKQ